MWLTLRLAAVTTFLLLLLGTPLAWWLARTRSWLKGPVGAVVALPLVLPPTVLGFYLLVAMGPAGPVGAATQSLGLGLAAVHVRRAGHRLGLLLAAVRGAAAAGRVRGVGRAADGGSGDAASRTVGPVLHRCGTARAPGLHRRHRARLRAHHRRVRRGADDRRQHSWRDQGAFRRRCTTTSKRSTTAARTVLAGGMLAFSFLVLLAVYGRARLPSAER